MKDGNVLGLLTEIGAILNDSHIVYTSGRHGAAYINKDALYPHTQVTSQLCLEIARHFAAAQVDVVLAPAIGGVILSQWVAYHLTQLTQREVLGVYAEKSPDHQSFLIQRGYDLLCQSKRILVVEDIITTGGSIRKVIAAARAIPSEVIGVAALCNRGGITAQEIGNVSELFVLADLPLESWEQQDCPLCKKNIPINTSVGKQISTSSLRKFGQNEALLI